MPGGDPKEEYKDLSDNMRHYANMRFAQLTLYFALNAGLVTAVFTANPELSSGLRLVLKLIGTVSAIAFGVMEERAGDYWHHFQRRASELEAVLGYKQYANRPAGRLFTTTNAARLLVWGGVPLWLLSVCLGR